MLALLLALLAGGGTYALTASNSAPPTAGGQGSGAISGYTVSGVAYTLDVTSPQQVTRVGFTLNAAPASAATVRAKVGSAAYSACTLSGSTATTSTWSCGLSGVTATTSATLRVVAAQ